MSNFLIPILLVCFVSTSGEKCDESRAIDKIVLEEVSTPEKCIIAGTEKSVEVSKKNPDMDLEFVTRCANPNRQKT